MSLKDGGDADATILEDQLDRLIEEDREILNALDN